MSKHTPESSPKTPKIIPQKIIDQVKKESAKARKRYRVPFVFVLLTYVKTSDCGKKKVEYNNPLRLTASGSEVKVYTEGMKCSGLPMCKASYRNHEECYERFCIRHYNKPQIRAVFDKYKTGGYSVTEMLKHTGCYDLIETMKKYDITNIEEL